MRSMLSFVFIFFTTAHAQDTVLWGRGEAVEFYRHSCVTEKNGEFDCGRLTLELFDADHSGFLDTPEAIEVLKTAGLISPSEKTARDQKIIAAWLCALAGGFPRTNMQSKAAVEIRLWSQYLFGYQSIKADVARTQRALTHLNPYLKARYEELNQ